ncbi:hypothetical protein GCM10010121_012720 [Streptomyces brasiliensis]|uniref:Uncharacterized protein n=1 Tax=Streptomyces brasiliensis TaxID=1954 RepID=A0A917K8I0_9ACTN|nr:hypothetical protein GCM10010121_012720 [Streptomyces brasiliensis]
MAGAQDVLLALDVAGGLQDVQRVCDGVALTFQGCTDLRGGGGALGNRGEDVVVEGVLGDARVLTQQVLRLRARVDRPARVQESTYGRVGRTLLRQLILLD